MSPRADDLSAAVAAILAGEGPAGAPPGFASGSTATANLRSIARSLEGVEAAPVLVAHLAAAALETPDPDTALNRLEQFLALHESPAIIARELDADPQARCLLMTLFAHSRFFTGVLTRQPDAFLWLMDGRILRTPRTLGHYRREVRAALAACGAPERRRSALARLREREMLRIGVRDILGMAGVEATTREISELAQTLIAAAADIAYADTVARFGEPLTEPSPEMPQRACGMCVLGMGKLGGRELNFASDVDLIFIYDDEGQTSGLLPDGRRVAPQSNHVFFTRMGEAIVRFLAARDADGQLYRVDMRLRPEGASGPLARSLDSFLNYLRLQARDWERIAYLKARVLYGPSALAERIYRFTQEFVFSEASPALIVSEVKRLKEMIDREVANSDTCHREVKRGHGGIREIEFVVSAMQIIYGRMHRALRARNIFVAIERLREVGLLRPDDADFYLEAYEFLRMVEHRLQMDDEAQTHLLPAGGPELELVARKCLFVGADALTAHHRAVADRVHAAFVRFFEHDTEAADRTSRDLLVVLNRETPPEQAAAVLAGFGLEDPANVRLLRDLAYGTSEIFISAEGQRFFEQMLPSLLRLVREAPNPAGVLPQFHSFMLAIKGITYYYELVAQHPDILRLLVRLFGTSETFGRVLVSHPEFFDAIISTRLVYEPGTAEEQRGRLAGAMGASRQQERRLVLLRRAVRFEELLAALRHLLGLSALPDTLRALASTADNTVDTAMGTAAERTADRFAPGMDRPAMRGYCTDLLECARAHFAIVALGKYGGGELNFFGDLDVVFVFDDGAVADFRGHNAGEVWQALSHGVTAAVSENMQGGRAYSIDARLRPHGRNSPLATGLSQYRAYLLDEAETWEMQSFLRARHVWGNPAITGALQEAAARRRARLDPDTVRAEIRAMRRRLEESVADADAARGEFKRAPGGLVDIEFALQLHGLLAAPGGFPASGSYFAILDPEEGGAPPAVLPAGLGRSYAFFRAAETAVRLVRGVGESVPPADPAQLRAVERLLGIAEGTLRARLADERAAVRAALADLFG